MLKPRMGLVNIDHLFTIKRSAEQPLVLAFTWMLLDTTHPNTVADQVHPLKAAALSDGSVFPTRTHKLLRNEMSTWPPNSQDPVRLSIHGTSRKVSSVEA